jgi:hypothetical protein
VSVLEDVERVEQLAENVGAAARQNGHLGEREDFAVAPWSPGEGGGRPDQAALAADGAAAGPRAVDVDAVERARLPATAAQEVGEAGVGSVDVEETNSCRRRSRS